MLYIEFVELKNQADGLIHSTEKTLADAGDNVDQEVKTEIEADIAALKDVLAQEDPDQEDIQGKLQALVQSSMKLGEAMYQPEGDAGDMGADMGEDDGPKSTMDDDVVDADFEEVDDDDNTKKSA